MAIPPRPRQRNTRNKSGQPEIQAFYKYLEEAAFIGSQLPGPQDNQEFSLRDGIAVKRNLNDMFYLVPPTGTSITLTDIYRIMAMWISANSVSSVFEEQIKNFTGAKYCILFNSGRAALDIILRSIDNKENNKTDVIIPAYTCFSVAAAIAKSGLKIRLVDIDPSTLDYNYEKLRSQNFDNVLAIIGCNLFGVLSDWSELESIATREDIYLIDDAAQSLGTTFQGKASGSLGDAGFYSLGRGKNLSTISGGVLITDDERTASIIHAGMRDKGDTGFINNIKTLLKIMTYSLFLRPRLYWLPDSMPFLKLGQTVFDEHFISGSLSEIQKCAAAVLFPRLEKINVIRSRNAKAICRGISCDTRFLVPGYSADRLPIYLRLPVLAQNRQTRDKLISVLKRAGIKSSSMYPSTIRGIEGIEKYLANPEDNFEGAETVAERLFTLPTHHYVKDIDVEKIIDCIMRS
jgi:dTDP-4-amino-4,6-dideoxygalactose transaminase